ncbi:helix-turn-helix transcriptional regulator [Atopobacter phocae]|uniref:helix-turn-helix transcriptional regulator n=1 Tax=Atopobacter phocae TaxID=136492 RepID=UPI00047134D8|nr:helix-turn-helix transcriptional regulator [Atopobacter phocae]
MQWNLIKLRRNNKETQGDLANLLQISESGYRNKELGKSQFKQNEMFLLAEHFGKSVDDIFLPTDFTVRKHEIV